MCVHMCVCACVHACVYDRCITVFQSHCELLSLSVTVDIVTPRDVTQRGCQLSLAFSKPITDVHVEMKKLGIVVRTHTADTGS